MGIKKVIWNTLSGEEKWDIALERTNGHNRFKQYKETCIENRTLIGEMTEYLDKHNITPFFVFFPFAELYNKQIDPSYKTELLDALESLPYSVEFLDMNDYKGIFDDSDFMDADHLNMQGAVKVTEFLNEFMKILGGGKA